MIYTITALKALQDNYIWVIDNGEAAIVVDPTLAAPVASFIAEHKLALATIILTHGHSDHIGGVSELAQKFNPMIVDNFLQQLAENELISIAGFPSIQVILTPGHMHEHVCYLFDDKHLFCGDTLFSLGCGRVFTGDYQAMHKSLTKLKNLSKHVKCYPAHEYTKTNLGFTLEFDTRNQDYYQPLIEEVKDRLALSGISLPTTIEHELKYNLFLRDDDKDLWNTVTMKTDIVITNSFDCFYQLRLARNNY